MSCKNPEKMYGLSSEIAIFLTVKGREGIPLPVLDNMQLKDSEISFGKVKLDRTATYKLLQLSLETRCDHKLCSHCLVLTVVTSGNKPC